MTIIVNRYRIALAIIVTTIIAIASHLDSTYICVYIYIYMYIYIYTHTYIYSIYIYIYTMPRVWGDSEESFCGPDGISLRGALEAGGPRFQGAYPSRGLELAYP